MKLRTVVYSGKVEIDNVPIFSCPACNRSEVSPEVKPDLTGLIGQLGSQPDKQTFLFNEWNEWADLLVEVYAKDKLPKSHVLEEHMTARINKLLDLFLIAQSLGDEDWMNEIQKRLSQISRRSIHT
ncbi:hypothetical protein [Paenibacillus pinihumi]|uniref:hypothetical protein n=1 Tax=Paenibacillus pinihumi TaxID=669462 RepID=UPI0003F62D4B